MSSATQPGLLLGEWACLGVLYQGPTHGFAIAARLKPSGDIGRVWTLSRPLTYRAIDQLVVKECAQPVAEEPGLAGGNRTILAATRRGKARFREWAATPVDHLRDLRSELLLKLVLAEACGIDTAGLLVAQQATVRQLAGALGAPDPDDVVALWRSESAHAAERLLDRLMARRS